MMERARGRGVRGARREQPACVKPEGSGGGDRDTTHRETGGCQVLKTPGKPGLAFALYPVAHGSHGGS